MCVHECVCRPLGHCSFQRNRLDLSLSSLLWPLCDVRVHYITVICVIIAHREESELLRKHTSPEHKSSASADPDLQPTTFLGTKAANFHWQRCGSKRRQRYGPIWGWMKAYLHQEWSIAGPDAKCGWASFRIHPNLHQTYTGQPVSYLLCKVLFRRSYPKSPTTLFTNKFWY